MADLHLLGFYHLGDLLALTLLVWRAVEDSLFLGDVDLHRLVFLAQVKIHILQVINLLVEHINVSQQPVILFLAFDEYILDLFDVG